MQNITCKMVWKLWKCAPDAFYTAKIDPKIVEKGKKYYLHQAGFEPGT